MNQDKEIELKLLKLMHKVDWIIYTLETLFKVEHQYEEADWSNDNEYGNPEWNAALDELVEHIENNWSTKDGIQWVGRHALQARIAELRQSPPTRAILDEAFIRKQEREKVIEEVREYVCNNHNEFGWIPLESFIAECLDTLKGGDGE